MTDPEEITDNKIVDWVFNHHWKKPLTREEILNPNYTMWGRARFWYPHQATCLISGFAPIDESSFKRYITNTSIVSILDIFSYYPLTQPEITRLRNVFSLITEFMKSNSVPFNNNGKIELLIQPMTLLKWSNQEKLFDFPQRLEETVHLGSCRCLDLPHTFPDDVRPDVYERRKKLEENKTKPRSLSTIALANHCIPSKEHIPIKTPKPAFKPEQATDWHYQFYLDKASISLNDAICLICGYIPVDSESMYLIPRASILHELLTSAAANGKINDFRIVNGKLSTYYLAPFKSWITYVATCKSICIPKGLLEKVQERKITSSDTLSNEPTPSIIASIVTGPNEPPTVVNQATQIIDLPKKTNAKRFDSQRTIFKKIYSKLRLKDKSMSRADILAICSEDSSYVRVKKDNGDDFSNKTLCEWMVEKDKELENKK